MNYKNDKKEQIMDDLQKYLIIYPEESVDFMDIIQNV